MQVNPYTTIVFSSKKQTGLMFNQYAFCDVVHNLSNNRLGWCYASKKHLAEQFDVSERSVYRWIEELQEGGWIEKDKQTGYIKTTHQWFEVVVHDKPPSDEMSVPINKEESNNKKKRKDLSSTKDVEDALDVLEEQTNSLLAEKTEAKPRQGQRHDSTEWYNKVFSPLYREMSGHIALTRPKQYGQVGDFFSQLGDLNPDMDPSELYDHATDCAQLMLTQHKNGSGYGWIKNTPDIGKLLSQVGDVNVSTHKELNKTQEEILEEQRQQADVDELLEFEKRVNEALEKEAGEVKGLSSESIELSDGSSKHKQSAGGNSNAVYSL